MSEVDAKIEELTDSVCVLTMLASSSGRIEGIDEDELLAELDSLYDAISMPLATMLSSSSGRIFDSEATKDVTAKLKNNVKIDNEEEEELLKLEKEMLS